MAAQRPECLRRHRPGRRRDRRWAAGGNLAAPPGLDREPCRADLV